MIVRWLRFFEALARGERWAMRRFVAWCVVVAVLGVWVWVWG